MVLIVIVIVEEKLVIIYVIEMIEIEEGLIFDIIEVDLCK